MSLRLDWWRVEISLFLRILITFDKPIGYILYFRSTNPRFCFYLLCEDQQVMKKIPHPIFLGIRPGYVSFSAFTIS